MGVDRTEKLAPLANDAGLAKRLWDWTDQVLAKFDNAPCHSSDWYKLNTGSRFVYGVAL